MSQRFIWTVLTALALAACSDTDTDHATGDASTDGAVDGGFDAPSDAGAVDGGADAPGDGGAVDAMNDAQPDAASDAGTVDAMSDAQPDAAGDAPTDVQGGDGAVDGGADSGTDASSDAVSCSPGQFEITTVDSAGQVGAQTSLGLDASGGVHISYQDITNQKLKYAVKKPGSGWVTSTVDPDGATGGYTALAVDGSGNIHVAYYRVSAFKGSLRYAFKSAGSPWAVATVDSSSDDIGLLPSIAVGTNGAVHIAYHDGTNAELKYATKPAGGSWTTSKLDGVGAGGTTALAVDGAGTLHAAYSFYNGSTTLVRHAQKVGTGAWTFDTVDDAGSSGRIYPPRARLGFVRWHSRHVLPFLELRTSTWLSRVGWNDVVNRNNRKRQQRVVDPRRLFWQGERSVCASYVRMVALRRKTSSWHMERLSGRYEWQERDVPFAAAGLSWQPAYLVL